MDPDFQRRMPDPDPDADPDNKFVYMTMAFFPDFLYCRDWTTHHFFLSLNYMKS